MKLSVKLPSLALSARWITGQSAQLSKTAAYPPLMGDFVAMCWGDWILSGPEGVNEMILCANVHLVAAHNLPPLGADAWTVPGP